MDNGEKLAAWRKLKGWSQEEAAKRFSEFVRAHVPQGTWAPWETGKKAPGRENAPDLEAFTEGTIKAKDWPKRRRARPRRATPSGSPPKRTGTDG